ERADHRRDVARVALRGDQGLRGRVAAGNAGGDLVLREQPGHAHPVGPQGQLDDDVLAELGELATLLVHTLRVIGARLDQDRAVRHGGKLAQRLSLLDAGRLRSGDREPYAVQKTQVLDPAG